MKITGKFVSTTGFQDQTIDVSPDDIKAQLKPIKKLNVGNKVWIEAEVRKVMDFGVWAKISDKQGDCEHFISTEDIIAVLPAEPEKEKELPKKLDLTPESRFIDEAVKIGDIINALRDAVKDLQEKVANIHCHQ